MHDVLFMKRHWLLVSVFFVGNEDVYRAVKTFIGSKYGNFFLV
ncbi:hypothetical protein VCR14J2_390149 [Vibrio coralliirubri]|nr:hypothetical protein VCR12J2_1020033 [Vibrio coralliirubri]CDU05189.1 hypothetical protein VCR14J2_390149 [Vibrio coralliirubri]